MTAERSFGDWLRQRRRALDLTQEELARQVGCSAVTLRKLESEARRPSKQIAERLATVLQVSAVDRPNFLRFARGDPFAVGGFNPAPTGVGARAQPHSAPVPRNNLPLQITSFIGREEEVAQICRSLDQPGEENASSALSTRPQEDRPGEQWNGATGAAQGARLLTLTGAGGSGKTRLALEAAGRLIDRFPDGVWLIELAPLAEPGLVPQAVAITLGLREQSGQPIGETLLDYLRGKMFLLILDNCEHLVEACARLADPVLHTCSGVRVLATSREALGIAGETLHPVPSLSVPDAAGLVESVAAAVAGSESGQLFVERARAVVPRFELTAQNATAVAQICRRLDGIPLAIELAAARVKVLTPEQIAARLDDRFRLLTTGSRAALPRQQTLRALIDWSYELLPEPERRLLNWLAVFAGGWTLEAAEAIGADDRSSAPALLDLLTALVNKSLVAVEPVPGAEMRYGLLETIRQYAREKLENAGEYERARQQHLEYYTALAETMEPALRGPEQVAALNRLAVEINNLRAALEWSLDHGPELGLRLAGALGQFWIVRNSSWHEGREWLAKVIAWPGARQHPLALAKCLNAAAYLARTLGDHQQARALYEEALPIWRETGRKSGEADALRLLGAMLVDLGELDEGRALLEESLALSRTTGDGEGTAWTLFDLGKLAYDQDDRATAAAFFEESLARHRALDHATGVAIVAERVGELALLRGDMNAAQALGEEAFAAATAIDSKLSMAFALNLLSAASDRQGETARALALINDALVLAGGEGLDPLEALMMYRLGYLALKQGETDIARAHFRHSLALCQPPDQHWLVPVLLTGFAAVYDATGQHEKAARLIGAAEPLYASFHVPTDGFDALDHMQQVERIRAHLDEGHFAACWAEGKALMMEPAIAEALSSA